MAKKAEYDKTPLEVAKVSTDRLESEAPWALAVASTGMQQFLGENFRKNKPLEYQKLMNWIAQQLIATHQRQVNISNYDLRD